MTESDDESEELVYICSYVGCNTFKALFPMRGHSSERNAVGGGGVSFPGKKRYKGVRFNVISVTRGWVGVKFPGKKRYITHECPLID